MSTLDTRAAALRRVFDAAFAAPPPGRGAPLEGFLAVCIGGDPHAIGLANVGRLVAAPKIVPVPTGRPDVLGVAAIRGALVSVHSLRVLLGYGREDNEEHRWLVIAETHDTVALAFEKLDGFVRVPAGVTGAITAEGVARPIVDVPALLDIITTGKVGTTTRRDP